MLNLTAEQQNFLKSNFKDNAERMLVTNKLDDILLPLDALITHQGFDDDYTLTDWGNIAQRIYDEIYIQNK